MRHYLDQQYHKLKKEAQNSKKLFVDPLFPASNTSLFHSKTVDNVEWKRPGELVKEPKLVMTEGYMHGEFVEGELGHPWFISACSALVVKPNLFYKVIPDIKHQEWDSKNHYAGIFKFNFWRYGEWLEVVIDDLLPTKDDELVFCHSANRNEFWSALLQKAYAKVYGDYEHLSYSRTVDALVDLTGGIPEKIHLNRLDKSDKLVIQDMFQNVQESLEYGALITVRIRPNAKYYLHQKSTAESTTKDTSGEPRDEEGQGQEGQVQGSQGQEGQGQKGQGQEGQSQEQTLEQGSTDPTQYAQPGEGHHGLREDYGYIVKETKLIPLPYHWQPIAGTIDVGFFKIQSPGKRKNWKGPWATTTHQQQNVAWNEQAFLGLTVDQPNEFWMPLSEVLTYFTNLEILHFVNTTDTSKDNLWHEVQIKQSWKKASETSRCSAGGGFLYKETFLDNPQIIFEVAGYSDTIMFALEQDDSTIKRALGEDFLNIGLVILKTEANRTYRMHEISDVVMTSEYKPSRSVFLKTSLTQGRYLIVPTTEHPGEYGQFILRIYSGAPVDAMVLDKGCPKQPGCCGKQYVMVTKLRIKRAARLKCKEGGYNAAMDAYVIVRCEKEKVRSPTIPKSPNPVFDFDVIFYRKYPKEPIVFEIYNNNIVKDDFIGQATLSDITLDPVGPVSEHELKLYGHGKDAHVPHPGELYIELVSHNNLCAF